MFERQLQQIYKHAFKNYLTLFTVKTPNVIVTSNSTIFQQLVHVACNVMRKLPIYNAGHAHYPVPASIRLDIVNLLSGKYPIQPDNNFLLSGNYR